MTHTTGRAGVAPSSAAEDMRLYRAPFEFDCAMCPSTQGEYASEVDGRPLCWQCWRGEQVAAERNRSHALAPLYRLLLRRTPPH